VSPAARSRALVHDAAALNLEQVDLPGALRCIVGVMVPLVVGISAGSVADGVYAAIGALCAGFASFQGAYRRRAGITVVVGVGMAAATATGALAGRADWSAILVVAAWVFVAGMLPALGQAALVVGLQWGVAAIIVNALPMTAGQALVRSAMILAGAFVQTVLVVLAWPIRSYGPERGAVAAAYRELAAYADSVARGGDLAAASTLGDDARRVLSDPHPLGRPGQLLAFQALVDEADRLRLALAALAGLRRSLAEGHPAREAIGRVCADAASVLRTIATAVLADILPVGAPAAVARLDDDVAAVAAAAEPSDDRAGGGGAGGGGGVDAGAKWAARDVSRLAQAIAGQLRSALRVAEQSAVGPAPRSREGLARPRYEHRAPAQALITLRANLSWQSGVLRHAVRLTATVTACMIIYRLSGLQHGYWMALTALLVLRQDYATTAVRGVSRIVGTILGAVLATIVVALLHPDTTGLAVMFGIAAFLAFVIVRVNYGLFSICVTAYVVFLLAFGQAPALATAGQRLVSTLVGGALALAAYLAWPTWESRLVGPQLGDLLAAQADYAESVLGCHAEPSSDARRRLGDLRTRTRLARSNAELSVGRMAAEPERSRRDAPIELDAARGILAGARRASLAVLTLHAHLPAEDAAPVPAVHEFTRPVVGRMRHNASEALYRTPYSSPARAAHGVLALVGHSPPSGRQPHTHPEYELREAYNTLVDEVRSTGIDDSPDRPLGLLLDEADELVDAVNSVTERLETVAAPEGSDTVEAPST
jgi:uncharacterized membrane protein YccC